MTRGSAQAGNRASKTGRYLQWLENRSEWHAVTSAGGQLVQLHPFLSMSICQLYPVQRCTVDALEALAVGYFGILAVPDVGGRAGGRHHAHPARKPPFVHVLEVPAPQKHHGHNPAQRQHGRRLS